MNETLAAAIIVKNHLHTHITLISHLDGKIIQTDTHSTLVGLILEGDVIRKNTDIFIKDRIILLGSLVSVLMSITRPPLVKNNDV